MLNNTFDIKKNIEFYLQNYKTRQSFFHDNEGFTLIELLVSVAIMTIVVSIVGVGLGTMLKENRKAESESDRRANLNRALDYITNEVRSANSIKTSASSGDNLTLPSGFNIPSNTYGLVLTFPDNTKSVYFLAPSDKGSTCNTTTSLWQCPFAVFRAQGSYASGSTIPAGDSMMVVDGLKAPTSIPSCSNISVGTSGFYGCISNNRQVFLSLYGKLTETDSTTLEVSSTAVIRAK
ncbi:type II secretion system protein [Aphanizomenon flos-aquae FACHB-1416]|uniref:type II secretion system protein n=1 Tax=Aphanizomenon flos-aquae TaxID=1176 RepID=UPI00168066C2|nr:type II secretion system protein [Aphanizomenon flos-aquae]MBD2389462.1 type II secretion system protein [Aphanizomenon flos-aquae FACHB-1171]MBD2555936.1 type II secretion system protein [Aphanizomenon flos-aquae FACHB-1290]MBD2656523.1 type II secretion system protein [Aphanizomenon flos-aquae FACHB-1265]MBD2674361.1 type II secretion system protein [Aphanizomenon flos-aquae FACHB-1416]MBD2696923.1 type II secretion system protein [Aphanizomenon flos-aquae FACHB-1287]